VTKPLTLMAVCPHPDDECTSAGAVLAMYAEQGVRTVVVTCTNGEMGDGPGGVKPGERGHDPEAVAHTRLAELAESCRILNVTHSERLGYRDSGMADWDFKDHPNAFANVPVEEAVDRLVALMEKYEPDVVICDDDRGGYDHPDHLRSHLVTTKAVAQSGIPKKLYMPAFSRHTFETLQQSLEEMGVELPMPDVDDATRALFEEVERRITTVVDASAFGEQVHRALAAHASQIAESWFSQIPAPVFAVAFGKQHFIRIHDITGASVPESDLFAGCRV
jgi:LmbE family N-acetylglucosaminyl deacetylase